MCGRCRPWFVLLARLFGRCDGVNHSGNSVSVTDRRVVIPGRCEASNLRCAIAHRGISRFRVRFAPRNDGSGSKTDNMSNQSPIPRFTVITLGVSDMRASIAFYEALGFARKFRATGEAVAFFD